MQTAQRATRRSRRQGSVLIEGIIAITTIAILFAGARFLHVMHTRKSETLREARYRAWGATRPRDCARSVHGQDERSVNVPHPLRQERASVAVQSALDMVCNEVPHPKDDMFSVLEWAFSNGDSMLEPVVDAVQGFFRFH